MSGGKRTTIVVDTNKYNRIIRDLIRARDERDEAKKRANDLRRSTLQKMKRMAEESERRNEERTRQVREEMRGIEQGLASQIRDVWAGVEAGLEEAYKRDSRIMQQMEEDREEALRRDKQLQENIETVDEAARARDQQLQANIDQVHRELHERANELQGQINTIEDRYARAGASAEAWCSESSNILDYIRDNLRHEKFFPGRLAELEVKQQTAQDNYGGGMNQAAVASAQSVYLEAQQLRLQIEAEEAQWNARLNAARAVASELEGDWEADKEPTLQFETNEGTRELQVDMDHWTDGEYSTTKKDLDSIKSRLDDPENLSQEEIDELQKQLVELRKLHIKKLNLGRQAVIASQLRTDTALVVADALKERGWHVVDSAYEGEDHTGALHIKLQSGSGEDADEMVIVYTPERRNQGTDQEIIVNAVKSAFFDKKVQNPEFWRERQNSIEEAIRSIPGQDCDRSECIPGYERKAYDREELLDMERVRAERPQKVLRSEESQER